MWWPFKKKIFTPEEQKMIIDRTKKEEEEEEEEEEEDVIKLGTFKNPLTTDNNDDGICLCGAYTLPPFLKIDKSRPYSFKPNDSTPPPPPNSEFVHCFCCDRHFRVIT